MSGDDLRRLALRPAPRPEPIKPLLRLVEEVVLLSLDCSWIRKHNVARIAAGGGRHGPGDYNEAVTSLVRRGMLTHVGPLRKLEATNNGKLPARQARVTSIIRRPVPPEGADAELLVLLAAAGALALTTDDHLRAHTRVASIGHGIPVPPVIVALADELGTSTMTELADRLLPASREDLRDARFANSYKWLP